MHRLPPLTALFAAIALLMAPDSAALAGKREDAAKATAALKSGDAKQKVAALAELGKLGQIQKSFVADAEPTMVKLLDDKDAEVRAAAARAVGMIDPDAKEVLPKLRKMLATDKSEVARLGAAAGIGAMGTAGKPALGDLRKVMGDNDKGTKLYRAAMTAAKSVNPKKQ